VEGQYSCASPIHTNAHSFSEVNGGGGGGVKGKGSPSAPKTREPARG
jgi:hypothetical protein